MSISAVYAAGITGLNTSVRGLAGAAHQIATVNVTRDGADGVERAPGLESATDALIDLERYVFQGKASVHAIAAADEMVGSLLDELA